MFGRFDRTPTTYGTLRGPLHELFVGRDFDRLVHRSTLVSLSEGQRLTVQGTLGREVLVIAKGTADVVRDGRVVGVVGAGEMVGELALLTDEPRSATVIATSPMTAFVLSRAEFRALLDECPNANTAIWLHAIRRMTRHASNQSLAEVSA